MEIFVERLNKLLTENKISKYRLAKDLKLSKQTVLWWCAGINEPRISYLHKLRSTLTLQAITCWG